MLVDFHSHTYKSDGTSSPAELQAMMKARGVEIYAVTDHDTLAAYPELSDNANGPKLIVGIEINTTLRGDDVHILGYRLPKSDSPLDISLARHRETRAQRLVAMVEKLNAAGIRLSLEELMSDCENVSALGRPHIAKALISAGYVHTIEDAFNTYLRRGCPGFVEAEQLSPFEAIDMIKESGGIPILAHPGRLKDLSIIESVIEGGIAGIEVFYGTHTPEQTAVFHDVAERHNLLMSAGADFHDLSWTPRGVGMEVNERDIAPFLAAIGP